MNPPPPAHQASSSSSKSKPKQQPNDGNTARKGWFFCGSTGRKLPLDGVVTYSAPTSANEETEPSDPDGGGDGGGQWQPWADIATPLLDVLLPRLSLRDRVIVSSVCRLWHDFLANHPSFRRPRFPCLMFRGTKSCGDFYCLSGGNGYYSFDVSKLNFIKDMRCTAASHGWLLFSHHRGHVNLLNPLSKACIDLPTCPRRSKCAAFSAAPTEPSCTVMHLTSGCGMLDDWDIFYCSIRDKIWHVHREQCKPRSNIAALGEKFYFLCQEGLAELDFSRSRPLKWLKLNNDTFSSILDMLSSKNAGKLFNTPRNDYHWLLISNGELLAITLFKPALQYWFSPTRAEYFAYFHRADFINNIWVKVENLSDRSLFLSMWSCFSVPVVDAREHVGGCVYLCAFGFKKFPEDVRFWQKYTVLQGYLDDDKLYDDYIVVDTSSENTWFMPTI